MFFLFFPISDICSEKWFQCGWTLLSSLWSLHCSLPFSSCNPPRWVLFCRSLQRFAPPDCVNALSEAFFLFIAFSTFQPFPQNMLYIYDIYTDTHTQNPRMWMCVHLKKQTKDISCLKVLITPHLSSQLRLARSTNGNEHSMGALIRSWREAVGENSSQVGTQTHAHAFYTHML